MFEVAFPLVIALLILVLASFADLIARSVSFILLWFRKRREAREKARLYKFRVVERDENGDEIEEEEVLPLRHSCDAGCRVSLSSIEPMRVALIFTSVTYRPD